jgi:hypothetical protein
MKTNKIQKIKTEKEGINIDLSKGIKEIRNIKMSTEEKKLILQNILKSPIKQEQIVKSPYVFSPEKKVNYESSLITDNKTIENIKTRKIDRKSNQTEKLPEEEKEDKEV